jgi:hypothetical protein
MIPELIESLGELTEEITELITRIEEMAPGLISGEETAESDEPATDRSTGMFAKDETVGPAGEAGESEAMNPTSTDPENNPLLAQYVEEDG